MKDIANFERPYSSRIIDSYVKLINEKYPTVDLSDLYNYSDMKEYEITDQAQWFTQNQVDLFYERAVQLTGNKNLAREAGQFFASFQEGNLLKKYLLSLFGTAGAFEQVELVLRSFTNYTEYKVKKLSRHSVEVTVFTKGGVQEKPYQCENRIGMLEAIPCCSTPDFQRLNIQNAFSRGIMYAGILSPGKIPKPSWLERSKVFPFQLSPWETS